MSNWKKAALWLFKSYFVQIGWPVDTLYETFKWVAECFPQLALQPDPLEEAMAD